MKAGELTDTTIAQPKSQIVIELPNGQRIATNDYWHGRNGKGEPIIVIKAGRKLDS